MRIWLIAAGLAGAFAVAFGAYAAHGLAPGSYESDIGAKAAHYALIHALALLAVDRLAGDGRKLAHLAGALFLAGILFFSGSLVWKSLAGDLAWPLITPTGGFAFIGGWLALALMGICRPKI